jgi:hypothetical protein
MDESNAVASVENSDDRTFFKLGAIVTADVVGRKHKSKSFTIFVTNDHRRC